MNRFIISCQLALLGVLLMNTLFAQNIQIQTIPAQLSEQSQTNIELYDQWMTALISGEFVEAGSLMSQEFTTEEKAGTYISKAEFLDIWESYHTTAHSHEGQIRAISLGVGEGAYEGEWILAWGTAIWTPNQQTDPIESQLHQVVKIENGKIAMLYTYQNELPILLQMGAQLSLPEEASRGR